MFASTAFSVSVLDAKSVVQKIRAMNPTAWYDPSDLSTLWKDTAGTDPVTADGDMVARMDDKSGNGNHATQGTSSLTPLYKTSGGLRWLQFDGTDDGLNLDSTALDYTQSTMALAGVLRSVSAAYRGGFVIRKQIIYASLDTNGGVWGAFNGSNKASSHLLDEKKSAILRTRSASDIDLITDGTVENVATAGTFDDRSGAIGRNATQYANIDFYGGLVFSSVLTDAQVDTVKRYHHQKMGV